MQKDYVLMQVEFVRMPKETIISFLPRMIIQMLRLDLLYRIISSIQRQQGVVLMLKVREPGQRELPLMLKDLGQEQKEIILMLKGGLQRLLA